MFVGPNETRVVRKSLKQYAVSGGHHGGKPYLSLAEHDRCVCATFGAPHDLARKLRYDVERRAIEASR
jgi:hypothetical protein